MEAGIEPRAGEVAEPRRSSRDASALRSGLEQWLASQLPAGAEPRVGPVRPTSANGMSSETFLFEATWQEGGRTRHEELVARVAPEDGDCPVFPVYDLRRQFQLLERLASLTTLPVPKVFWYEEDAGAVGSPLFVMSRVEGEVPPDIPPYNFGGNWLFDLGPEQRRHLQDATVGLLASLHAAPVEAFSFLDLDRPGATPLRRHVANTRAWYEFAKADGGPSALVEAGFDWLEEHWPEEEGEAVVSWGDSRIGNVMYRDLEPVAAFDWEMAALGPRELDVGWLIWAHRNFEDLTEELGLPGMPDFLRPEDVAATYEARSGQRLGDLGFYLAYAAVQFGIVYLRIGRRQVRFGERPMPDDPDELLINRGPLERIVTDSYWR